jgi:selenide,water dikinase
VGLERADDAAVYRLTDEIALIQTVDFITPIVDDPITFGEIAAANSLSDVYTMGGRPLCAMNIVCFPAKVMDVAVLQAVLRGGLRKIREAGAVLAGGHSVEDAEMKYGLAVTGVVHPDRIVTKGGALPGDRLILTKPLGTGIVATALKAELADPAEVQAFATSMATLNRSAAEAMLGFEVHACTDVTGFGLVGHLCEMLEETDLGAILYHASLPLLPGVSRHAELGLLPAGLYRNLEYREAAVEVAGQVPQHVRDAVFDPQTSGGLLIALPAGDASALVAILESRGAGSVAIIGEVVGGGGQRVHLQ